MEVQAVELTMPDGVTLRGQRWGDGPDWIVMLHDSGGERDLDDWRPLLPAILSEERSLVTLDLRGHGASDGDWVPDSLGPDIESVLDIARSRGAAWIAMMGAGFSAAGLLEAASQVGIDALVLLSPMIEPERGRSLRGKGEPKLFAVGSRTESLYGVVRETRNRSIGWAMLVSMPTEQQGVDLITSSYGSQLVERIVTFLAEQRMLARSSWGHSASAPPKRTDANKPEENL